MIGFNLTEVELILSVLFLSK